MKLLRPVIFLYCIFLTQSFAFSQSTHTPSDSVLLQLVFSGEFVDKKSLATHTGQSFVLQASESIMPQTKNLHRYMYHAFSATELPDDFFVLSEVIFSKQFVVGQKVYTHALICSWHFDQVFVSHVMVENSAQENTAVLLEKTTKFASFEMSEDQILSFDYEELGEGKFLIISNISGYSSGSLNHFDQKELYVVHGKTITHLNDASWTAKHFPLMSMEVKDDFQTNHLEYSFHTKVSLLTEKKKVASIQIIQQGTMPDKLDEHHLVKFEKKALFVWKKDQFIVKK